MGKSDAGGPAAGEMLLERDDTTGAGGAARNGFWEMRRRAASGWSFSVSARPGD
jgi:hypothetical protein